jgi:subtilisin family serine protease
LHFRLVNSLPEVPVICGRRVDVRGNTPHRLFCETLEGRTLLSLVGIDWHGAHVQAFAGHFVVEMDGMSGAGSDQLNAMNAELVKANARYQATRQLGADGTFLLEDSGQERKGELKLNQAGALLGHLKGFKALEPDLYVAASVIPNDPYFPNQWALNNTGQTGGTPDADIDAPEAWDITTGSSSVVVGVIDTGIDYTHPDLDGNVWTNPGEVAGDGIDNDGNGFVDDVHGWDFANNDSDPFDDNGHGTHVSGTIAAEGNNGVGVTGVSWSSKVMALKFLAADGSGSTSAAISAINYAVNMKNRGVNVRVLNNSWGGPGYSSSLFTAIQNSASANMLFVAAAGNNGTNNDTTPNYPASYDVANVISVAATDANDNLASFSNYGASSVDVAAPGVSILSTYPGNQYAYLSGTSMATPHVSGIAALGFSYVPTATYAQVRTAILNGVDVKPQLTVKVATGGRVNALKTLQNLASVPVITTPAAPSNLTATALSRTSIRLSFLDNASNESGFIIQRSRDGQSWSNLTTIGPVTGTGVTVSYTDNTVVRRTKYYYRVLAYNSAGNSAPSNIATATTPK